MSLCTQCGAIFHYEDKAKHVCKPANIPTKGTEKLPQTTNSAVV